jgi:hypothetical protein
MKNQRDKILGLHKDGLKAIKIRNKLLGREDLRFYITGGHFSKRYLIENILQADF